MLINPVVERALESLSLVLTLTHEHIQLDDPRDRALAHQHFEILWDGGETFIPHEVMTWARRNGWPGEAARELGEIARSVKDQPRRRHARRQVRDNVLLEWRKTAASSAPHHPVDVPDGHGVQRNGVAASEG